MNFNIPKFKSIRIEINSDCNRKCSFCPRGTDKSRWDNNKKLINKKMSTENVLSIIDQNVNQGFNANVGFDFYNEITLDDRLLYFCKYAKNKKLKVDLVTNGDLMIKDEHFTKELFNNSNYISISLYDYKDKEGRKILMSKWDKYLDSLGILKHQYGLVGEWFNFGNRGGLVDRKNKYLGGSHKDKLTPIKANCKKIHTKMNIRYDGEVPICCEDSHVRFSLGNVFKSSLEEVWFGDRMKLATSLLRKGERSKISPCSKCVKSIIPCK